MHIGLSYFECRRLSHVAEELAEWAKRGASFVVFTYSENDFLFYREFMSSAFAAARKVGLEVWADPWGLAGIFSGETRSWFVLYYPETWQVRVDGRRVPSACLNAPQTLEAVHQWIDAVAAGGAEWVLWDEPHWWYAPRSSVFAKKKRGPLTLDTLSLVLSGEIAQALSYIPRRNRALLQISKVEGEYNVTSPDKWD